MLEGGSDRDLHRLDLLVKTRHAVQRRQRQMREYPERDLCRHALSVRRNLVQVDAAIRRSDWRHPISGVFGEVATAERAARRMGGVGHALGQLAPVKRRAP